MEKSLFNITSEYRQLMSIIEENGGEITDEIAERLAINAENLQEKAVGYGHVIRSYEALAAAAKAEKERIDGILKMAERAADGLKDRLAAAMKLYEVEKIDDPTMRLSFRKSTSVDVPDVEKVPKEFVKINITKSPDKNAIKAHIKDFGEVPWASIVESKNLQIK